MIHKTPFFSTDSFQTQVVLLIATVEYFSNSEVLASDSGEPVLDVKVGS